MTQMIAVLGVLLLSAFLAGQALFILVRPAAGRRYLLAFASTLRLHLLEQGLRLLAGACLITAAALSAWPLFFTTFGWLLIGTSIMLLILPWRWHRRFAQWVMPPLAKVAWLYAVASMLLGMFLGLLLWPAF